MIIIEFLFGSEKSLHDKEKEIESLSICKGDICHKIPLTINDICYYNKHRDSKSKILLFYLFPSRLKQKFYGGTPFHEKTGM